jgi:hypothetical protein
MRILLTLLCALSFAHSAEPRWWKGNLHTHTLWSDGDDYPEMVADWYKQHGYNFLALSDHNILSNQERWISVAKSKGGDLALKKYLQRFGDKWVELRDNKGDQEVRLKMLSEFRVPLEEPGGFLMIASEEITSRFLSAPVHINATNIREKIEPQTGRSIVEVMQKTVDLVNAQRARTGVPMFSHINHPNFGWALTAEELMQVDHERFFEIYNGHPTVHNEGTAQRASTDRIWDIMLTKRLAELGKDVMFGLGVDDSHAYHDAEFYKKKAAEAAAAAAAAKNKPGPKPEAATQLDAALNPDATPGTDPAAKPGAASKPAAPSKPSRCGRGWIMVRAAKLDTNEIVAAIEAGDFYASSGVTLKDVRREGKILSLEIEPEPGVTYTTEFLGTRKEYDRASEPVVDAKGTQLRTTRKYSKDIGAVLATTKGTSASYELRGDEIYVRARVTSTKAKADPAFDGEVEQAWTQPLVPKAEK